MNPFLNEIFHILYPLFVSTVTSSLPPLSHRHQSDTMNQSDNDDSGDDNQQHEHEHEHEQGMDGYLFYIFGIVVRDLRLCGQSAIGDLIHEMREIDDQVVAVIPHAYELLFKAVELNPYNWSVTVIPLDLILPPQVLLARNLEWLRVP
jgi:hypothetical protein